MSSPLSTLRTDPGGLVREDCELSDAILPRMKHFAAVMSAALPDAVDYLLRWALEQRGAMPAIVGARGQHPRRRLIHDSIGGAPWGFRYVHHQEGCTRFRPGSGRNKEIPGIGEWIMYRARIPHREI